MLEKDVQRQCLEWLQLKGFFCWRNNNTGIFDPSKKTFRKFTGLKGVSDILGITPSGLFLAIEVKSSTGKMSPEQNEFQQNIVDRGGISMCVHSLDELIQDFKEVKLISS